MKKIFPFLFIVFLSQIFFSCRSYVNLDFVNRKLIKKLPDQEVLKANKPIEENLKVSEEAANSSQEKKLVNEFYANENKKSSNTEKNNLEACNKLNTNNQFSKIFFLNSTYANKIILEKPQTCTIRKKNKSNISEEVKDKLQSPKPGDDRLLLEVILSIFLPPVAVYLHQTEHITNLFWIDLLLTICFWFPGIIFALLVVFDVIHS